MRRLESVALLTGAVLLGASAGYACGDKLLLIGRGVRFQHAYAQHQANLVIYSSGAQNGDGLDNAKLQAALKHAGHKLVTVETAAQLDAALKSAKVDVVLAGYADVARIAPRLQSAPSNPVLLPVLYKPSKAEMAAAQKEYRFALKAPAPELQFLTTIDEAMKSRVRNGARS
jgi:hypothetical protein